MVSWIALLFSIAGVTLNARMSIWCWPVWMVANLLWAYIGYRKDKAMMLVQLMYFWFGVYGWYQWSHR